MTSVTTTNTSIPAGPWTVDDLDAFPEDNARRYELIDGALLVSAEPSLQHQRVSAHLLRLLQDAAPAELEVFMPIDVRLSPMRQIAPDITVVRRSDAAGRRLSGLPLLVVEVQSPSTRAVDLTLKRRVLEEAGVQSYWLVDPDDLTLTVLDLAGATYREATRVSGQQAYDALLPFAVRVVPAELAG